MRKLISDKIYHQDKAVGSSFLKTIRRKSLYHAIKEKHKVTEAMILGRALHCLVLTPEEFDENFCLELNRSDFSNVVDTVEEIKDRITELTALQMNNITSELERLRKDRGGVMEKRKRAIDALKRNLQARIDNVDPELFKSKKSYNAMIRQVKEDEKQQVISMRGEFKAEQAALQTHIKQAQKKIASLKSYRTGKREKLIKSLKILDPQTIVWAELKETYRQDNLEKDIISATMLEQAVEMKRSVMEHPVARGMLRGGECEYAYFTICPDTGLPLKVKPDLKNMALIDLKSARDASNKGFMFDCLRLKYHVQAAYYLDVHNQATGEDLKEFYFIVIENTYPFAANVVKLGEREIELGRKEYKAALRTYADYLEKKDIKGLAYFGYGQEIGHISYPESAFQEAV